MTCNKTGERRKCINETKQNLHLRITKTETDNQLTINWNELNCAVWRTKCEIWQSTISTFISSILLFLWANVSSSVTDEEGKRVDKNVFSIINSNQSKLYILLFRRFLSNEEANVAKRKAPIVGQHRQNSNYSLVCDTISDANALAQVKVRLFFSSVSLFCFGKLENINNVHYLRFLRAFNSTLNIIHTQYTN